ncbi:MAG: c-type cytochrome [Chitinophagales bacterium]
MYSNKIFAGVLLFGLILMLSSFNIHSTNEKKGGFRNLQVLPKDISHDDMDKIMDAYCESLNVKCNFCHVRGDMASDTLDEKKIARKMIVMTNEINDKYFGKDSGTLGCMTCHNGKKNPSDAKEK